VTIYRRDKEGRLIESASRRRRPPMPAQGLDPDQADVIVRFNGELVHVTPAASMTLALAPASPGRPGPVRDRPVPTAATARRALENGGSATVPQLLRNPPAGAFAGPFVALVMLLLSAPWPWPISAAAKARCC
jgi:lipopolysaccharide export system permease protein